MAVKKSDLYTSLWQSCDELRGGMDASQYKDYVLVLLFMKYVSDRASDPNSLLDVPADASFDALVKLKGNKDIGEEFNKVIGRLAQANDLQGVIDVADFNDDSKLGKGQEMVDRLSRLIGIFENPALDFSGNRAGGDDLLGDAYEYLMRNFATESGKSKGQFYTPAEVSRIMASVIDIDKATKASQTIHDPACGSGSLLLKAHDVAKSATGLDLTIYGQEMDNATAALARMNMWLHDAGTATIENDNTLARPRFTEADGKLKAFDFVVANPPFSTKAWSNGLTPAKDPYGRFDHGVPPAKNGDYAFLLHILACLKTTGKASVILPHGVLFRGNAEAAIRRAIAKRGYIKGIIGLPSNLFYGTGIPACIIVLDKEGAADRDAVFMVDASKGFAKDGAKNRLRERDLHRIVDVFTTMTEVPGYSRLVPLAEIADPKNAYNLNLPRYVDSGEPEDLHDLSAHLRGGIPNRDIDLLAEYWETFPKLRDQLVEPGDRVGYSQLRVPADEIRSTVLASSEVDELRTEVDDGFQVWASKARGTLEALDVGARPKAVLSELAESLLDQFRAVQLVDEYAVYQRFMGFWDETMSDDVHLLADVGWSVAVTPVMLPAKAKGRVDFVVGADKFRSELLPAPLLIDRYLPADRDAVQAAESSLAEAEAALEDLLLEHGQEGGLLEDAVGDKGKFTKAAIDARRADLRWFQAQAAFPNEAAAVAAAREAVHAAGAAVAEVQVRLGGPGGELSHVANARGALTKAALSARLRALGIDDSLERSHLLEALSAFEALAVQKSQLRSALATVDALLDEAGEPGDEFTDEREQLGVAEVLLAEAVEAGTKLLAARAALESGIGSCYGDIGSLDVRDLVVVDKWISRVAEVTREEVGRCVEDLAEAIVRLAVRYHNPLPLLVARSLEAESRLEAHLRQMGVAWT